MMYSDLKNFISTTIQSENNIAPTRRQELQYFAKIIVQNILKDAAAHILFICTHNSRRSHLCQIWSTVAADYYKIHDKVKAFSGGTEVTALNPRIIKTLQGIGFKIESEKGENPVHLIFFDDMKSPIEGFSKLFTAPPNPEKDFIAIMNCTEAEEACPLVLGASARIFLPYSDPKISDDTPSEADTYYARTAQIAAEMFCIFADVKNILQKEDLD